MSFAKLKRSLLAGAVLVGAFAAPAQAFIINEASVDGLWFNNTQNGRGLQLDYFPTGVNTGVVFFSFYSYDQAGQPLWLSNAFPVTEGQFQATASARRYAGGSFGTTFTPPNPVDGTEVADVSFNFESCTSLRISVTPRAGTNLPAAEYQLSRGDRALGFPGAGCAYTQTFTACPAGTTAVPNQPRTCQLQGTYTQPLRLTNNTRWVLNGKVQIGQPLAANGTVGQTTTITIEPGTLIRGATGGLDYLQINPGSKIYAEGTAYAPIVFTGPTEESGSWGGVVIAGLARNNAAATAGGTAAFEADPSTVWGGNNDEDSSGVLRYVQIRNAGRVISGNVELNSLTLGSVGSRTVIEYVQAHNGLDDGVEFFGGTVNAKYIVVTRGGDDGLDFDVGGYRGRVQFAYVQADDAPNTDTADGSCVESDNHPTSFNNLPRAQPKVANLTCQGRATAPNFRRQIRIRRGSGGEYYNVVVANQPTGECVTLFDADTFAQVTAGTLFFRGSSLLGCATNFAGGNSITAEQVTTWFNTAGSGNATGAIAGNIVGRIPVLGGSIDTSAVNPPADSFFETVPYRGAFGPAPYRDWTYGWTAFGSVRP
jgi:hypothetical protein